MRDRLRDMRSMLTIGIRIDRRLTVSLVALTVLTNLAMTLRALWFALLVDAVVDGDLGTATTWAAVLAVSDAVRSWALVGSQMDRQDLHDRALQHFQEEAMRLAGDLPGIEHHERPEHIDRVAAYRGSFASLGAALGNVVDVVANTARALVTLVLLGALHPALVLVPVFAVPSLITARRAERIRQHANLAAMGDGRLADHLYGLVLDPTTGKEVKVAGNGPTVHARQDDLWRQVTHRQVLAQVRAAAVSLSGWTVFAVAYLGAVLILVRGAADGTVTAGGVLLGVVLAGQVNMQVATGATLVTGLTQATHAIELRRWLLDYAARHAVTGTAHPPATLREGIRFEHVSFAYPDSEREVLIDIDVHLPAGAVVALVGENGAGKTSLVKLLCGLYQPTAGHISVDGIRLADIDPADWRRRITTGFQDFARFEFLARESVGVGDLPRLEDHDAIHDALERAAASDLAASLPSALDTQLGHTFGGVELSGGQWQKLALGRALMPTQPLLVILDEPTASLDPLSEQALFERYTTAARTSAQLSGAITVLVSHRFSTVRGADLIVVVDSGRIVELGSHPELIATDGLYAELYDLQARAYR